MNTEKAKEILLTVAVNNGVPLEEVIYEIEKSISIAYQAAERENNVHALTKWQAISQSQRLPTAEELIVWLHEEIDKRA